MSSFFTFNLSIQWRIEKENYPLAVNGFLSIYTVGIIE